jgi:hypothetical protein
MSGVGWTVQQFQSTLITVNAGKCMPTVSKHVQYSRGGGAQGWSARQRLGSEQGNVWGGLDRPSHSMLITVVMMQTQRMQAQ